MNDIRIGTRSSALAVFQARLVASELEKIGHRIQLLKIKTKGDLVLDKPLHKINTIGIFTKALDMALLNGEIDLAVHSLKDIPTSLPKNIVQGAVLKRGNYKDVFIYKNDKENIFSLEKPIIATGSLRRKAQWLHRYPHHKCVDLRGNVNKRLEKLQKNDWQGAIFSLAGLQRIGLLPKKYEILDWMVPAPAQGTIAITTHLENTKIQKICHKINHFNTELTSKIERDFMKTLEGGCTAPIGALAKIKKNMLYFQGGVTDLEGKKQILLKKQIPLKNTENIGTIFAKELLEKGGADLIKNIKRRTF